jgi:hypothetical protein
MADFFHVSDFQGSAQPPFIENRIVDMEAILVKSFYPDAFIYKLIFFIYSRKTLFQLRMPELAF